MSFTQYSEVWETRAHTLYVQLPGIFASNQEAQAAVAALPPAPTGCEFQILTRDKPKYMSWPTILGGQILDNKYWPAYKRHDNSYGGEGETKMPYIRNRKDADKQLYNDLVAMGMSKTLAYIHYEWVHTFNASRWTKRSWE